ncbi:MAG: hypothetical protein HC831_07425, partial [Chloroflexia bacterium]|nr:hypothetical protein [Chloroflexia bacterium]
GSCTVNEWVVPPYTNVQKILNVKKGMTLQQANAALGIEPYNIYNIQEDGGTILTYHYRTKQRKMTLPTDITKREKVQRGEERSQTEGEPWYDMDHQLLYVLFQEGKVKSLITDQGRADGEFILLSNNNIRKITNEDLTTFKVVLDSSQHAQQLIIPISDLYQRSEEAKTEMTVKKKKSAAGRVLGIGAAIVLPIVLLVTLL